MNTVTWFRNLLKRKLILLAFSFFLFIGTLLLALPGTPEKTNDNRLLAQKGEKKELRTVSLEKEENALDKLSLGVEFITEGVLFDNADLAKLNNADNTARDLTDDRTSFYYSLISFHLRFAINEGLSLYFEIYRIGLWGNDMLSGRQDSSPGSSDSFDSNSFYVGKLYLESYFWKNPTHDLSLRIGRQFFSIGGVRRDYIQRDILDAIVLDYGHKSLGRLKILLADFFGMGSPLTDTSYYSYLNNDSEVVKGFNGDVNTIRTGMIYTSPGFFNTGLKAYSFFARFGAVNNGGADRTGNGATGNFPDNDYAWLAGIRPFWKVKEMSIPVSVHFDLAYSGGIDRRGEGQPDAQIKGFAYGFGGILGLNRYVKILGNYFLSHGSEYNKEGDLVSHGFVSFKGDYPGGFLLGRIYGLRPSSYTANDGIRSTPLDMNRSSGTELLEMSLEFNSKNKIFAELKYFYLRDTSTSMMFPSAQNSSNGGQERLGKEIGQEVDIQLTFKQNRHLRFELTAGIFVPGMFLKNSQTVSGVQYGNANFWGLNFAMIFSFGVNDEELMESNKELIFEK